MRRVSPYFFVVLSLIASASAVVIMIAWVDSHRTLRARASRPFTDFYDEAEVRSLWVFYSMCGKVAVIGFYNPYRDRPGLTWHGAMVGPGQSPGPVKQYV